MIFKDATIHFFENGRKPVEGRVGFSDEPFGDGKLRLKSVRYNNKVRTFGFDDGSDTFPDIYCFIFDDGSFYSNSEFSSIFLEKQWVVKKEAI